MTIDVLSKVLASRLFPEISQKKLREEFIENWVKNDSEAYRKSFLGLTQWELKRKYLDVLCPVCMVGTLEDYTTLQEKKRFMFKLRNASLHIIQNSRHITPLDQPEMFNQLMLQFLKENHS
jgi:pimeloyl-ACP methyl ester carboxylesterase